MPKNIKLLTLSQVMPKGNKHDYRQLKLMAENIDDSREIEDADFTEIEKDTD